MLVLALLSLAVAWEGAAVTGTDPCAQYGNGCSTPLHLPMFYKTLFTPSCNKHDVCYRCGAKYGISKDTCDTNFLRNMEAACLVHDAEPIGRRRRRRDPLSLQKRSTCIVFGKGFFYEAVHLFGDLFYRHVDEVESFCSEETAIGCLPPH